MSFFRFSDFLGQITNLWNLNQGGVFITYEFQFLAQLRGGGGVYLGGELISMRKMVPKVNLGKL